MLTRILSFIGHFSLLTITIGYLHRASTIAHTESSPRTGIRASPPDRNEKRYGLIRVFRPSPFKLYEQLITDGTIHMENLF